MGDYSPKPLSDVLTYLDGLGFDHLYISSPSTGTARGAGRRSAIRAKRPDPKPNLPEHASGRSSDPNPGRQVTEPERISGGSSPSSLPTIPASPPPEQRAELFRQIQQAAESCTACSLSETRKTVVFGSGDPKAQLMLIGEGPGSEEDRQGLPFVGPAGALLTRILQAIGLRRDEVYIANVVKCRPPRNRDPKPDEVLACRGYLERQISLVQPKVILALGRVAAQSLLGTTASLGSLRGRWHQVQGVETRVTYHPAALLRNESWKRPTWEDLKIVRDRLQPNS